MRIELLLLLIKHYANNPANYILPRYIKSELNKPHNQNLIGKKYDYYIVGFRAIETASDLTAQGLLATIGNPSNSFSTLLNDKNGISTPADFEALKNAILTTGSNNIDTRPNCSEFIIYQFAFEGHVYQHKNGICYFQSIDHIFSVIQYKNTSGDLRYCMLQSYNDEQSLREFMDASVYTDPKNASAFASIQVMTHNEMTVFLDTLQHLVNAKTIDHIIENFYQKYFKVRIDYSFYNLCRRVKPLDKKENWLAESREIVEGPLLLNVQWVKSDMRAVCDNLNTHITAAQQQDAPQIIEISQNGDNQKSQSFHTLMIEPEQQNPLNPINVLFVNPHPGKLKPKTIAKSQLPIIEALQQPKNLTDIKYPTSKNETLIEFKRLIDEANTVSELQEIFDIACVCVNQHRNARWDSFWGIQNTSSLREIITVIREKALTLLFRAAPPEININARIQHFTDASNMSLFNKHKNNFILTGAFGRTHSLKVIENEIDRLQEVRNLDSISAP